MLPPASQGARVPLAGPRAPRLIHYEDIARLCLAVEAAPRAPFPSTPAAARPMDTHEVARLLEGHHRRGAGRRRAPMALDHYGELPRGTPPSGADGIDWAPRIGRCDGLARTWDWARTPAGLAICWERPRERGCGIDARRCNWVAAAAAPPRNWNWSRGSTAPQ